jgi:enoyl-CoA hydratase/carnithine racemase
MVTELTDYFRGLANRQERRIVVLKGAGRAYCAGLDIKAGGATEEALNVNIDIGSLEAAIALEDRNQILCAQTADSQEAMAAFVQRRKPEFHDA